MYARTLPLAFIVFSLTACSLRPTLPESKSFTSTSVTAVSCAIPEPPATPKSADTGTDTPRSSDARTGKAETAYICANRERINDYRKLATGLDKKEWGSGEVELVGGTLGAAGVVASSIPIAAGGAVLFGGSEVLSNFYGIEKQSDAYVKAYHAASCLQTIAESLRPDLFKNIQVPPGWVSVELYALHHLNRASEKVDSRLFESLRKRAVSQPPDFAALRASLEAAMNSVPANPASESLLISGEEQAQVKAQMQAIGALESNIAICLAL